MIERFAALVAPVARHLMLGGTRWPAVARLGRAVPGLRLGFDPLDIHEVAPPASAAEFEALGAYTLAHAADAAIFYFHIPLLLRGLDLGRRSDRARQGHGRRGRRLAARARGTSRRQRQLARLVERRGRPDHDRFARGAGAAVADAASLIVTRTTPQRHPARCRGARAHRGAAGDAGGACAPARRLRRACTSSRWQPPPAGRAPLEGPARIAFWNAERGKFLDASAALLGRQGAAACLLCELDLGMARSGQAHTARELAERLGAGYVFGVEFLELGLGDAWERQRHAGEVNEAGLHGAAILSPYPLERPALVRLSADGAWFDGESRRAPGRRPDRAAGDAPVDGRPVTLADVHFESHSDPRRAAPPR